MNKLVLNITLLLVGFSLASWKGESAYELEIKEWRKSRIENLKSENGWLNLAGLFWLEEGDNTFGADESNDFLFPKEHSEAKLGKIELNKGVVTLIAEKNAGILDANEKPVEKLVITDFEKPTLFKHQSLRWFIIKRGDKYAIRLRDLESPVVKEFHDIATYPIQPKWKIKAKLEEVPGKKVSILDVTGRLSDEDSPGVLVFKVDGKEYRLDAVGSKESLFVIFGDQTNKSKTYGGGRFLYSSPVDAEGYCWLDFNKAYNPPCAFTPYATCPLPPKQNKLDLFVTAGEKRWGGH